MANDPDGLSLPGVPKEWRDRLVQSDNETDEIRENGAEPTAHAASHQDGGADEVNVADLSGVLAEAQKVDVREVNSPKGIVPILDFQGSGVSIAIIDGRAVIDIPAAAPGTGGQTDTVTGSNGITNTGDDVNATMTPTYGAAINTVCQGNDVRLSDSRTPTAHEASHQFSGGDTLDIGAMGSASAPEAGDVAYSQEDGSTNWAPLPTSISDIGQWKYTGTQASAADPGTANFKVNNVDHTQVTLAWSSNINRDGLDISALLTITAGDRFLAQQSSNSSRIVVYTALAGVTQLGTYFEISLVYSSETANFSGFNNNAWYTIGFQPTAPAARSRGYDGGGGPFLSGVASGFDASAGYSPGDIIIGVTTEEAFICIDNTIGDAIWKLITYTPF